jgi:hypothetical protein
MVWSCTSSPVHLLDSRLGCACQPCDVQYFFFPFGLFYVRVMCLQQQAVGQDDGLIGPGY